MTNPTQFFSDLGGKFDIVPSILPVDLQGSSAGTGTRIRVDGYRKVVAFLFKAVGTDNDDPVISLQRHTANSGGTSETVNITKYRTRLAATFTDATAWAEGTQASGATLTVADSAQKGGMIAIEIDTADICDGTFTHFSMNVADTGSNAQLGCIFYGLVDKKYEGVATNVYA
jgi:hypothetical protein